MPRYTTTINVNVEYLAMDEDDAESLAQEWAEDARMKFDAAIMDRFDAFIAVRESTADEPRRIAN